jgi:hypothetical protein
VALDQRLDESHDAHHGTEGRNWQQRLLVAAANAQYTRRVTLPAVAATFDE